MEKIEIQEHISLQAYNTLAVDVYSRWFVSVSRLEQVYSALEFVKTQQCPLLVLGGGSNIVLTEDFAGLTLHINTQGIQLEEESDTHVLLSVAAGENWHNTVMYSVDQGWYGLENLALIPGNVGAAPVQNIGAYGVEVTQSIEYLEAVDIETQTLVRFDNADCQFAYRDSVFKHALKDKMIITRVVFKLSKTPVWSLDYPALQDALGDCDLDALTSHQVAQAVIAIRQSKLPDPANIPNAGSFFKNPIVDETDYQTLCQQYPKMVAYPLNPSDSGSKRYKLAAGWLLDNAGWKGKWVNQIAMHERQALVLTNPHKKSGGEILAFVEQVVSDIQRVYGICLEVEPRIYGRQRLE
ncbi:UDP-N-acetylmuramate dehydrogenase [Eionea flava]